MTKSPSPRVNRRQFLAASSAATMALPYFVPARAFGANDRIRTGHIGVGGRGMGHLDGFIEQVVAVCDVDKSHLAEAVKHLKSKGRQVDAYSDYRRLLERKDLDAVVIATPDHWHALPTIDACSAGKDVFVEKPLSLTVAEGRKMVEAARRYERVVQTGSQQRSDPLFRRAVELIRSGRLGRLKQILVGIPQVRFRGTKIADSAPPPELDFNFWLGPAPLRPYNANQVHYNFRYFWDYSGGQMTNWGAHHIDIAQWALDADHSGPIEIEGTATFDGKGLYDVTSTCRATHTFANGVQLTVGQLQNDIPLGATFIGTAGRLYVDRGKIESTPAELMKEPLAADAVHLEVSNDHTQNFLDCIKSRKAPISDVEIGHRSATLCHLGNIAVRLGRKIHWDAASEKILGDPEALSMLERPSRAPWALS
ncbi:Gfo/Idh/MocA family protein [Schlesneria paludicola]|uniref:Gfo/Idh/MocA family protein n=1 Tax=Schlesneria paludicola TaxID=360056 RepID=UPI00029B4BBE|nr:Gfo/Idh/MocA family oxidoreductase [Schlesneria paludicola]